MGPRGVPMRCSTCGRGFIGSDCIPAYPTCPDCEAKGLDPRPYAVRTTDNYLATIGKKQEELTKIYGQRDRLAKTIRHLEEALLIFAPICRNCDYNKWHIYQSEEDETHAIEYECTNNDISLGEHNHFTGRESWLPGEHICSGFKRSGDFYGELRQKAIDDEAARTEAMEIEDGLTCPDWTSPCPFCAHAPGKVEWDKDAKQFICKVCGEAWAREGEAR